MDATTAPSEAPSENGAETSQKDVKRPSESNKVKVEACDTVY